MEGSGAVPVLHEEDIAKQVILSDEKRSKLIAGSSRFAVWGVIVVLGQFAAMAAGFSLPSSIGMALGGAALLWGGAGSIATSLLVAKDIKKAPWPEAEVAQIEAEVEAYFQEYVEAWEALNLE